jgi:hypothetical protein
MAGLQTKPHSNNKTNARRHARLRHRTPFRLLWDEHSCQPQYTKAFCNEISEHGLSLETAHPIPVGTRLSLRAERGTLFGGARVKHIAKRGGKYVLGVQLSYHLLDEALALMDEIYRTPRAK